ncbi:MAG TPA: carbohydrate-binding family 9-like protein, partial [Candidatus Handelsmanbacteria bacterium]|nr:carbohydrate-binding family 9-like protein [Candidatus Handelsmanbacteria bacterium]
MQVRSTLLAMLLMAVATHAQDVPSYSCARTGTPPVIDGDGSEVVWASAQRLELVDVEDLTGQRQFSRTTAVKMLWDDDNIYFLFDLIDEDVWSTFRNRDDLVWQQEVVEIYLDPDGDGLNYAEIEINPLNTVFDLLLSRPWGDGGTGFPEWSPEFSSAVRVDGTVNNPDDVDRGWTVEVALPWLALATDIRDIMNGQ